MAAPLLERIAASRAPVRQRTDQGLALQDWVDYFTFGGNTYPLLHTSMQPLDEETLTQTAAAAYNSNGPVFALVLARLQVFSQARFQWTRFEGGVPTDLFGTAALRVLERPWPGGTTADLLARVEVDVSLAGNAYIRKVVRPGQPPRLNRLRPDWVIIVLGSQEDADHPGEAGDVEVLGYLYQPGGPGGRGQSVWLDPQECAHVAPYPDPDANFLGMSWISPLIRDVQADGAMTEHKRLFMVNGATPNLVIKGLPFTEGKTEAFEKLVATLEKQHTGLRNAYKTLYLSAGADATVVGKDFVQLDFAATQGKGESRLAAAAGVPPSWVGFSEGLQGSSLNAGNFTAARRRLADGTAQHWWVNVSASLEPIIADPVNARDASLWFDTRSVSFLREDAGDLAKIQAEEAQTIVALVRDGFTPESAIDAVKNHDWSRLVHSGLVSVQLTRPGEVAPTQPTKALGNGKAPVPVKAG